MDSLQEDSVFRYEGGKYSFELRNGNQPARLFLKDSSQIYFFYPGGDCNVMSGKDQALSVSSWSIEKRGDGSEVLAVRSEQSSVWQGKKVCLVLRPDSLEMFYELEGRDLAVDDIRYCRAGYQGTEYGFVGEYDEVYNTVPNFQERQFFHSGHHFCITNGLSSNAEVGGQALASACHCMGLHDRLEEKYLSAGVAALPGEYTWDEFEWNPMPTLLPTTFIGDQVRGGGFAVRYAGKKRVSGSWETPRLIFTFADSRKQVLETYLEHCYNFGYMPRPVLRKPVAWHDSPIYCTWHDQFTAAYGGDEADQLHETYPKARDYLNEELLEKWLGALIQHDCKPGIVILDDKWQVNLNDGIPDTERFPAMRRWIERCHERGIRVFLWTTAWNDDNLPVEQCITRDGKPVCGDITDPVFEKRFREMLRHYFSDAPDCLNADGVKMDGLLCLPTGYGLKNHDDLWGLELQKRYLSILYTESKKWKKDVCISTFCANPYLYEYSDMVRLADLYTCRLSSRRTMELRAEIYHQTMPGILIDTDGQLAMYMLDDYADALCRQDELGIPCLYSSTGIRRHHFFLPPVYNEFTEEDYRKISAMFRRYREKHQ